MNRILSPYVEPLSNPIVAAVIGILAITVMGKTLELVCFALGHDSCVRYVRLSTTLASLAIVINAVSSAFTVIGGPIGGW